MQITILFDSPIHSVASVIMRLSNLSIRIIALDKVSFHDLVS